MIEKDLYTQSQSVRIKSYLGCMIVCLVPYTLVCFLADKLNFCRFYVIVISWTSWQANGSARFRMGATDVISSVKVFHLLDAGSSVCIF
jgi:hypothetical protein